MIAKVIFLHGAGSVGKTSIATKLQEILDEPYLRVGLDSFMPLFPQSYLFEGMKAEEGIGYRIDLNDNLPYLHTGKIGQKFISSIQHAIATLAEKGNNLIIDELLLDENVENYQALLRYTQMIHVGIFAPLALVEEREKGRSDRLIGQTRKRYESVYVGKTFDVIVDTSQLSPIECAKVIQGYLKKKHQNDERLT